MTPLSWTVLNLIYGQWVLHPDHDSVGNIGGRPYLNISLFASVLQALGRSRAQALETLEGTLYMRLPQGFEIPGFPLAWRSLPTILFSLGKSRLGERRGVKDLPGYLAANPGRCAHLRRAIQHAKDRAALLSLWHEQIEPHVTGSVWQVMGSVSRSAGDTMRLRRTLHKLVGPDDAQTLISNLSASLGVGAGLGVGASSGSSASSGVGDGSGLLASLGPVVGIARLARGQIGREAYLEHYGHRGPHEFELSYPRPVEDPDWLDGELDRFRENPVDVDGHLARQRAEFEAAWVRLQQRHPRQAGGLRRRIDEAARWARAREAARSEYVRDRWLVRSFALRAGELTGLESDVFFLTLAELLALLSGDEQAATHIPLQRETYERYRALPAYPSLIVGPFDPFQWAADPGRRTDLYDACSHAGQLAGSPAADNLVTGAPGAVGRVEALVRRVDRPEHGDRLQAGEVLVTKQTDISWTLLFPRAAAVVTDVGAPLSHAAIVARELGIPAVVGCGDATMRLQTGDRVRVDGGQGTVEIVRRA
jgi:pyruvate,water dikinase